MILGITLTALTFVSLVLSITAYYLFYKRNEDFMLKVARMGFYTSVGLIAVQAVMLMTGILTHKFEWIYVFSYSSRDLPLYYLISTFWAGQEGTFLLWLIFGSIFGIVIIHSRKDDEPLVMSFMCLIQAFVTIILIKKNPFAYVWQVNPGAFQAGSIPVDGTGLNPLLQNPWMVIHPPILFSGYTSTMILFAFAMAALIRKQHDTWIKSVFPFALFVGLVLGTGIIMGGYWAYTTLGWGGYWAWDPVENSSFIPWLVTLALIHGMIIQRRQGGMKRVNIFLAIAAFLLVLYGSFLTRSGVLTDFSVHSFSESEISTYLVAFVFLFTGIGLITYLFRVKGVRGENINTGFFTRELFMAFGMIFLLLLAAFTFVGTSWPIFSGIFGDKAVSVDKSAYNMFGGPIAILIALLISLAPVFSWKRDNAQKIKSVFIHMIIAAIAGAGIFIAGIHDLIPLLVTTAAIFILLVNGEIVFRMIKSKTYAFGGYLTHVGIGLMLIGIITSDVYDYSTKITLPLNEDTNVFGYNLRYGGKEASPDGKDKVLVTINDKDLTYAKFYWSDYSQAYMVAPSVVNMPLKDLYISPIQIIPADQNVAPGKELTIKKKSSEKFENYTFTFKDYEMNDHEMGASNMVIKAVLDVTDSYGKDLGIIKPGISVQGKDKKTIAAQIPGTDRNVFIKGVSVEDEKLILGIDNPKGIAGAKHGKELLAVEVTIKPLINILWLGAIIMAGGFITSIFNRTKRQKL